MPTLGALPLAASMLMTYRIWLLALLAVSCAPSEPTPTWWKGNLHTHSLWSDGDDYPEMILDWYKTNGYHFMALSDHNILADHERWIDARMRRGIGVYERYLERFGDDWVEQRETNDTLWVRLKTFEEYRSWFEERGRFLVFPSEEISDRYGRKPIHVNATNIQQLIEPQGGNSVLEVMQNNVNAVLAQREATGVPMFPHINHPYFGWAMTPDDLIDLEGERFFEVYNGHPAVNNYGDSLRAGLEHVWDIVLTERLVAGRPLMYGLAVDDAHNYHDTGLDYSNVGRGWVVVRAETLTPETLIAAMETGDFYASTGVTLADIQRDGDTLSIRIDAEEGVAYTTSFVGTRQGYEPQVEQIQVGDRTHTRRTYGEGIGEVFATMEGTEARYILRGDELYVRAKITSSKRKVNPYQTGEVEVAWTQPIRPSL